MCMSPEAVLGGDPVTLSVLTGVRASPPCALDRLLMSRSQISARLSEMDAQLVRLQSIADHIDREFSSTRLVRLLKSCMMGNTLNSANNLM